MMKGVSDFPLGDGRKRLLGVLKGPASLLYDNLCIM